MIHRSENVPSAFLTIVIALAGILVLLANNAGVVAQPLVMKSISCILCILMMNRIGVTTSTTFFATALFALLIVLENPVIPFAFSEKNWTIVRIGGAALFAFTAIHSIVRASAAAKRARATIDKRDARVGFRH